MSLAPQSVYPRLVVKKAAAKSDTFQLASRALFPYYTIDDRLTHPDPLQYSVESLPGTVYSLPRGSIFDFISFLPSDMPDFRVIPVDGSKSVGSSGATSASGTAAPSSVPIVFEAQTPTTLFMNSRLGATKTDPIFNVAGSLVDGGAVSGVVGDPVSNDDTGDTEIQLLKDRLGDDPRRLSEHVVKDLLGSDYNAFEFLLLDATIETDRPLGRDDVLRYVIAGLDASEHDLLSLVRGQNRRMTKKNVKLSIAYIVLTTMANTLVARITEELAFELAKIISKAVEAASR